MTSTETTWQQDAQAAHRRQPTSDRFNPSDILLDGIDALAEERRALTVGSPEFVANLDECRALRQAIESPAQPEPMNMARMCFILARLDVHLAEIALEGLPRSSPVVDDIANAADVLKRANGKRLAMAMVCEVLGVPDAGPSSHAGTEGARMVGIVDHHVMLARFAGRGANPKGMARHVLLVRLAAARAVVALSA